MSIRITTLSNGLRVATDTMADAESVVIGAWVGVGTRHEPWNANGIAHLVEHMMFKGTKKRSAYALSAAIETNGGTMNAHTTREETAYYARVLPEDTRRATDIIADMLQHSVFNAKELRREKQVITQEIGRDLDSPEMLIDDNLYQLAFPKQKMGRPILGSAQTIARLPRKSIAEYVRKHYHAGNMVMVATGKIDHDAFVEMATKHFGRLPKGKTPPRGKARIYSGGSYVTKEIEQLHIILGFPGPGFHSRDIYAAQLLAIVLGGSSSSRLFQKIREKRGLVYTVSCNHVPFADTGIFQIYAGTDPQRAGELIPVAVAELKDVTKNISQAELNRAKAQGRADMMMGQESVMRRADILGHQLIAYGRPIPVSESLEKLMDVTTEDVEALATKLFAQKPLVAALGPLEHLEDYQRISRRLKGA